MSYTTFGINEMVIFAFDADVQRTNHDVYVMSRLKNMNPTSPISEAVGSWEGITERSWVTTRDVFEQVPSNLVADQFCILRAPTDGKNEAYVQYQAEHGSGRFDGRREIVGRLSVVDEITAKAAGNYTYLPLTNTYFVAQ